MSTSNTEADSDRNYKRFKFSVDASRKGLKGNFTQMEFPDGKVALLNEPIKSIFTDAQLVSHETGRDFQIIFGKSNVQSQESIAQLVLVLSFDNLIKFRNSINEQLIKNESGLSTAELTPLLTNDDFDIIVQAPMIYTDRTYFYSPSEFIFMSLGNMIRIYFGRLFGNVKFIEGKSEQRTSLFQFECIIEINQLTSLRKAIETNISNFENKYNISFSDVTKMSEILEDN